MNLFRTILFLFVVFFSNRKCHSHEVNTTPEINYEMIPLQRWKVSRKELIKLKEKLKIFIASEIQKEGSKLIRKYYKEFYNIEDADSEDNSETNEMNDDAALDKIIESIDSGNLNLMQKDNLEDNTEMELANAKDKNRNTEKSFTTNGPIILV